MYWLAAGLVLKSYGEAKANADQAMVERGNADFYREQADFAEKKFEADSDQFHEQSKILFGEQESAFAKAGVDTADSAYFMAIQETRRYQELGTIKLEAQMNVRLAKLRAIQSDQKAASLTDPTRQAMGLAGNMLQFAGSNS